LWLWWWRWSWWWWGSDGRTRRLREANGENGRGQERRERKLLAQERIHRHTHARTQTHTGSALLGNRSNTAHAQMPRSGGHACWHAHAHTHTNRCTTRVDLDKQESNHTTIWYTLSQSVTDALWSDVLLNAPLGAYGAVMRNRIGFNDCCTVSSMDDLVVVVANTPSSWKPHSSNHTQ
jgi:hypothetical protein